MRILVLSFYFNPDLSAGSFRACALLKALSLAAPTGTTIDLLTTQPNRYESFRRQAPNHEEQGIITIQRFQLPSHRSGFVDQSRAFLSFACQSLSAVRGKDYDIIVATSGRLFTAALASLIARKTKARLYLDIRDIFVDTMASLLSRPMAMLLVPLFRKVEQYAIGQAARINLVSGGFLEYFHQRYPKQSFGVVPNGIDDEFLLAKFNNKPSLGRITVLYAGNIGSGQGLERILPGMAKALEKTHDFVIVGDGSQKTSLEASLRDTPNVCLLPPVNRSDLIELYRNCDVLFLHLNNHDAFLKVLPSKLFEYAATGKPMLAGVAGYAAQFLAEVPNARVFAPCDVGAGISAIHALNPGLVNRTAFINRYRRSSLMASLADDIFAVAS